MRWLNIYLTPAIIFSILTIVIGMGVASVVSEIYMWILPTAVIGVNPVFYWVMYFKEAKTKKK